MGQHLEAAGQVTGRLGLHERLDQIREGAVADAATGRLMAKWVLPTLDGPSRTTFSARSTKPSSCWLSTCSRLTLGWKAKSNSAKVFTVGSREERIAVCRRRLLRSTFLGYSSAGRALQWHCRGQRFDSAQLHHLTVYFLYYSIGCEYSSSLRIGLNLPLHLHLALDSAASGREGSKVRKLFV